MRLDMNASTLSVVGSMSSFGSGSRLSIGSSRWCVLKDHAKGLLMRRGSKFGLSNGGGARSGVRSSVSTTSSIRTSSVDSGPGLVPASGVDSASRSTRVKDKTPRLVARKKVSMTMDNMGEETEGNPFLFSPSS